jgi:hypothetical protein
MGSACSSELLRVIFTRSTTKLNADILFSPLSIELHVKNRSDFAGGMFLGKNRQAYPRTQQTELCDEAQFEIIKF